MPTGKIVMQSYKKERKRATETKDFYQKTKLNGKLFRIFS